LADYVLSRIPKEKEMYYIEAFDKVANILEEFIIKDGKIEARSV